MESNITMWDISEIVLICFLGVFVPFGRENAFSSVILASDSKSTDSCKEIDEFKCMFALIFLHTILLKIKMILSRKINKILLIIKSRFAL